jgi:hypothetical protein
LQVLESYSEELGLGKSDIKHCHAALVARGPKKVAAVLAAVRTVQFMDRYGLLLVSHAAGMLPHMPTLLQQSRHRSKFEGAATCVAKH